MWLYVSYALVAAVVFYFLYSFFSGLGEKRPPVYSWLLPSLKGKHNFKEKGILGVLEQGYKKKGDIFSVKAFGKSLTFLIGPDAQGVLFGAKDDVVVQRDVYRFTVPVFGPNIVYDAHPKVMAQQLKMLKHGLNGAAMQQHGVKIVRETEAFFGSWSESGEVSLFDALGELTIMTASRCLLGQEVRETMHAEVAKLYHILNEGMTPISFFFPNFPIAQHRKRDKARNEMIKKFSVVINRRKETGMKQDDFLQALMDAKYTDGTVPTTEDIGGLLLACLFAGQHTSSITSTWTGMLVLTHAKQLLPRIEAEQKEALAVTGGKLNLESLAKMPLLMNCVKETLRMFPPLILLMRKVKKPLNYKDYVIPEGEVIISSPAVGHRLQSVYTNPDKFDPDRFERGEGKGKYDYISFGAGRHACLGQNFGLLQVTSIWSVLFRHFDFELIDQLPSVDYTSLVAGPKGKCMVRYRRKKVPIC